MRITSVMTLTVLAVALSIGRLRARRLPSPRRRSPMTFTGQVQGVDVPQGLVAVHGPKQGTQNGNAGGQVSVVIVIVKVFKVDRPPRSQSATSPKQASLT